MCGADARECGFLSARFYEVFVDIVLGKVPTDLRVSFAGGVGAVLNGYYRDSLTTHNDRPVYVQVGGSGFLYWDAYFGAAGGWKLHAFNSTSRWCRQGGAPMGKGRASPR